MTTPALALDFTTAVLDTRITFTRTTGAVEILRFSPDVYFSGVVAASDVYMTPGEGL